MDQNQKYIFDQAHHFISNSPMEKRLGDKERRERVWALFLVFCQCCGTSNTVGTYKGYRAACMAFHGFDLPKDRPRVNPTRTEKQPALFLE